MITLYSDDNSNYDIGLIQSQISVDKDSVDNSGNVSEVIQAQTTLLAERTRLIIYFLLALLIFTLFKEN